MQMQEVWEESLVVVSPGHAAEFDVFQHIRQVGGGTRLLSTPSRMFANARQGRVSHRCARHRTFMGLGNLTSFGPVLLLLPPTWIKAGHLW